jgi:hypothetical protein
MIAPGFQICAEDAAKVFLGGTGWRAIVIGQIEMGNTAIERAMNQFARIVIQGGVAKVVP